VPGDSCYLLRVLTRVVDRTGHVWAELSWTGDRLERLVCGDLVVDGEVIDDPLLGPCHRAGATVMTALDWARPTTIPAIAAPGKLPPGTGGVALDVIARLARDAGVEALRYAGPYPTSALWRSLQRSFRSSASEDDFTASLLDRMAQASRDELPIDFQPAPHDRVWLGHGDHAELRDGLERVVLGGVVYERDGSPARLVEGRAEVWFGDRPWAHVATLSSEGALIEGPHPLPACTSDVVGKAFPPPLRHAIAELVAEAVPALLADDARRLTRERDLRWADLGARAAAATADAFVIHAAIWERIAPLGLARVALAIAEAVTPVVTHAVIAQLMPA